MAGGFLTLSLCREGDKIKIYPVGADPTSHLQDFILYSQGKLSSLIEIDLKTFPPCHGKEISIWEWKRLKWMKYIVHVSREKR